jgi:hypothetical protein
MTQSMREASNAVEGLDRSFHGGKTKLLAARASLRDATTTQYDESAEITAPPPHAPSL